MGSLESLYDLSQADKGRHATGTLVSDPLIIASQSFDITTTTEKD